jgi:hypothetical protein
MGLGNRILSLDILDVTLASKQLNPCINQDLE